MAVRWEQFVAAVEDNDGCASLCLARRLGVPDGTWRTWVRRRPMHRIVNGAYALTERPPARTRLRAHLDALDGSLLGGRSALWAHHGARQDGPCRTPFPLEVVWPHGRHHRSPAGVRVRRSRTLLDDDLTWASGWPCTSVERTVMDLVADLDEEAALALCIDVVFHGLSTPARLLERATATPTARGATRLAEIASDLEGERSDSIFEWWVRRALAAAGLRLHPGPRTLPTPDGPFEVDICLADVPIAIECDGRSHAPDGQRGRDAAKQNALLAARWTPLRTTYQTFVEAPDAFVGVVTRQRDQLLGAISASQGGPAASEPNPDAAEAPRRRAGVSGRCGT